MKKILLTSLLLLFSLSLVSCSDKNIENDITSDDINVEISEEQDKSFMHIPESRYREEIERMNYYYCMDNNIRFETYKLLNNDIDRYLEDGIKFVKKLDDVLESIEKDYSDIEDELDGSYNEEEIKLGIVFAYVQNLGDFTTDFLRAKDMYQYDMLLDVLEEETKKANDKYDEIYNYYVKMHPNATQDELDAKRQLCDDNIEKEIEPYKTKIENQEEILEQYGDEKTILDELDIWRINHAMEYVD